MPKFIPIDKIRKLREAAKGGDERAKRILSVQLEGKDDFMPMLDEFFAPPKKEEPAISEMPATESVEQPQGEDYDTNPKLVQFLELNKIGHDSPDYDSFVADFYKENPGEKPLHKHHEGHDEGEGDCFLQPLIDDEIEAVSGYQAAILKVISDTDMPDTAKKGIITDLEEIKRDEMEHLDKLRRMKASIEGKKEAKEQAEPEKNAEMLIEAQKTIV